MVLLSLWCEVCDAIVLTLEVVLALIRGSQDLVPYVVPYRLLLDHTDKIL